MKHVNMAAICCHMIEVCISVDIAIWHNQAGTTASLCTSNVPLQL